MKLEYTLYILIYPLLFALLMKIAPGLPPVFSIDVFQALLAYLLTKLGIEIIGAPIRAGLVKIGFKGFAKS